MVAKALTKTIIPQFGIPEKIYCDNGTHFVNKVISHLALALALSNAIVHTIHNQ